MSRSSARRARLPGPLSAQEVRLRLAEHAARDRQGRDGRLPLYYYFASDEVSELTRDAYRMFYDANALASAAFPSCAAMDAEVVDMVLGLLWATPDAGGCMTSGGTESIPLAVKAAKAAARARALSGRFNIVVPVSAHPAFDKAADLLELQVRRVELAADYRCDVDRMRDAVDDDTILVAGSAPSLPCGLIDPIRSLGELALECGVWLHVDACIGGLLAPFVEAIGDAVPAFDFRLPGLRSISADLHKFGYAGKGASLVLYCDRADLELQTFRFSGWPKGEYETRTMAGTRSGGAIAGAWAVMRLLGQDGYCDLARRPMHLRDRYMSGFSQIGAIEVIGAPELSVVAVTSRSRDIFAAADALDARGWYLSLVNDPPGIHQTINPAHEPVVDEYLDDLSRAMARAPSRVPGAVGGKRRVMTY